MLNGRYWSLVYISFGLIGIIGLFFGDTIPKIALIVPLLIGNGTIMIEAWENWKDKKAKENSAT